jgi:small-conductance mechanosensitive channel
MDIRAVQALVLAFGWLVVIVTVRFALQRMFAHYEQRLAEKDTAVAARRRTTFSFLLRIVVALLVLIGIWSVLSVFPATREVASAFLASSAVIAIVAGVSLSTPLGNLGSGVLLAFTHTVRLGDRITVGEHTGVVEEITLSNTALVTDEGRHVFVPNQTMVSTVLVNRSVGDPRRLVTVRLPVRLTASLAEARRVAADAASGVEGGDTLALDVQIAETAEKTVWLHVVAHAPSDADVAALASNIREQAITALREADLLPAA